MREMRDCEVAHFHFIKSLFDSACKVTYSLLPRPSWMERFEANVPDLTFNKSKNMSKVAAI